VKVVIAVQARLGSKRLPEKAMADVCGRPLVAQLVRRMKSVRNAHAVVVACPEKDRKEFFWATGTEPVTGPEDDVLTRMLNVLDATDADKLVKVGADCPLCPPDGVEYAIAMSRGEKLVQNTRPRLHPDGFDFDIWDADYLRDLDKRLKGEDREWFASWAMSHDGPGKHVGTNVDLSKWRLTVDYPEDLELIRAIFKDMKGAVWGARDVIEWCAMHPDELKRNAHLVTNFGARPK
jgi:spore coat polysaccharide biosynthesis protein SpsF (cytidylyltransferase family)